MPSQEDLAFARVAIQNKLLTQEQVGACLKMVERFAADGKAVPLSQILLQQNLLKREQLDVISCLVQYRLMRTRDSLHAKVLLERNLVPQAKIDLAVAAQQQFFKQSRQSMSILDVLVNQGDLKRERAADVMRAAEKQAAASAAARPVAGAQPGGPEGRAERVGKCQVTIRVVSLPTGRKATCVALTGQLDGEGIPGLQKILAEITDGAGDESKYLVLSLEGVTYISSAGVGLIASLNKSLAKKGGAFELANVPKRLQDILTLVGWGPAATLHTMEQALAVVGRA